MSSQWAELDRRARSGDRQGVASLLRKATEQDRLALAPTVEERIKGMRPDDWWSAKHNLAGGYALAVIGCMPSAARAAAVLCRRDMRDRWRSIPVRLFLDVARIRQLPWLGDLAVRLAGQVSARDTWSGEWEFASALLRETGAVPPITEGVVRGWLNEMHQEPQNAQRVPLAVRLRNSPYLDVLLPAVFDIDGVGSELNGGSWNDDTGEWDASPRFPAALAQLVAEGRLDRKPLIDATVDRLVRGDRPAWLRPFAQLHDALSPSTEELAEHTLDYARLLPDAPSTVAGLAQRALRTLDDADRLELDTLLEVSSHTLLRNEKTLVKAQLSWLEKVARRERDRTGEVLETVAAAFGHPALDVQDRALTLIGRQAGQLDAATMARLADAATALAGDLPARAATLFGIGTTSSAVPAVPVLPPPPPPAVMPPPITGAAELAEEVVALVHEESAVRWERALAGIVTLRATGDTAALACTLKPVLDRYLRHCYDDRLLFLSEVIRSLIASVTHDRDEAVWRRMVSSVRTAVQQGRRGGKDSSVPGTPDGVLLLRIAEVAVQPTPVPLLVSTPTLVTGSLDAQTLLERLMRAEAEGWQPWPIDEEQALLRVPREVDNAVTARAEALTSPAGRRFAEWLATGGLPDPVSTRLQQRASPRDSWSPVNRRIVVNLQPARTDGLRLESQLLTLTRRTATTYYTPDLVHENDIVAMVLPQHRDVVAAWALINLAGLADQNWRGGARLLPLLAECSGPFGPAMSLALAYVLGARQESDRVAAVDAFLALAAGDEPFAAAVGTDLGDLCGDATVKLSRVVPALRDAHQAGASAAVWELLTAAIPLLLPTKPRGLPDLLELATRAANDVGAKAEIPGLTEMAAGSGSSRLLKEAKRLHRVLTR